MINVNTVGAMNQFRIDASQTGAYASLPSTTGQKQGNRYKCTDSPYEFIFDGSAWQAYLHGMNVGVPPASLSASGNWVNQASASVAVANGIPQITDTANENSIHGFFITAPSTPYTITALLSFSMAATSGSGNYPNCGIGFSDGTKFELLAIYPGTLQVLGVPFVVMDKWTNSTTYGSALATAAVAAIAPMLWLRIKDDGTNRLFSVSTDGVNWTQVGTEGRTTYLTATKVGWFIRTQGPGPQVASLLAWTQT